MELSLTTPALLFPAVSLLLLAYTNRFLALGTLIRELHRRYQENGDKLLERQILQLRRRVVLIRRMQAAGTRSIRRRTSSPRGASGRRCAPRTCCRSS